MSLESGVPTSVLGELDHIMGDEFLFSFTCYQPDNIGYVIELNSSKLKNKKIITDSIWVNIIRSCPSCGTIDELNYGFDNGLLTNLLPDSRQIVGFGEPYEVSFLPETHNGYCPPEFLLIWFDVPYPFIFQAAFKVK